jgi:hypothetical protein
MSLKLQEALTDDRFELALRRLHSVVTLESKGLSDEVLRSPRYQLEKSKKEFGDRFSQVQAIYPAYKVWADSNNERLIAWQIRCSNCRFQGNVSEQEDITKWCEKYSAESRTCPEPCPDYAVMDRTYN